MTYVRNRMINMTLVMLFLVGNKYTPAHVHAHIHTYTHTYIHMDVSVAEWLAWLTSNCGRIGAIGLSPINGLRPNM